MNRTWRLITAAAVIVVSLTLGSATLRAENSGVFRNSTDISRAQSILVDEGYLRKDGYTPGQLDQTTREAISEFQTHHTLNNVGILDDDTYQLLLSHEFSYPWSEETARVELAPAEPVAPVAAVAPPAQVQVAEAAPVPEPTPAPEVQEAPPAPEPVAAPEEPARTMPATASHLPLLALSGLGLLGLGVLVLIRRSA
jgi:hypothetical protein